MADDFMFMVLTHSPGYPWKIFHPISRNGERQERFIPDGGITAQKRSLPGDNLAWLVLLHPCRDTKQAVRLRCLRVNGFSQGMISRAASFYSGSLIADTASKPRVPA
jgi:hypothetical protein